MKETEYMRGNKAYVRIRSMADGDEHEHFVLRREFEVPESWKPIDIVYGFYGEYEYVGSEEFGHDHVTQRVFVEPNY